METTSRLGLFMFLGLVIGAIVGRWGFGYPVTGALLGAGLFGLLGWFLDNRGNA